MAGALLSYQDAIRLIRQAAALWRLARKAVHVEPMLLSCGVASRVR